MLQYSLPANWPEFFADFEAPSYISCQQTSMEQFTTPETSYVRNVGELNAQQGVEADMRVQVAVVGGGFTGITAALELAERGYHVCVLEAQHIGNGCSGRNGGHLMQGMQGWPSDFSALRRSLPDQLLDLVWDTGQEGVRIVRERTARHKIDCGLKFGHVLVALHRAHMRELALRKKSWEQRGYQGLTMLPSRQDVKRQVASDQYCGGLHDAHSGQIQPLQYLHGLSAAAMSAGAKLYEHAPVMQLQPGQPAVLSVGRKTVRADHVALCGNAYLQNLSFAAMRSRMAIITSLMIATVPLSEKLALELLPDSATVLDCNTFRNWFRIGTDRRMIFGGRAMFSKLNSSDVAAGLVRQMREVFPQLEGVNAEQAWSGYVGTTINRLPHFGKITDNIRFAQGFSGHGVALAGVAGRIIAEDIAAETDRLAQLSMVRHFPFPGGLLRAPAVALGMRWFRFRDFIKAKL